MSNSTEKIGRHPTYYNRYHRRRLLRLIAEFERLDGFVYMDAFVVGNNCAAWISGADFKLQDEHLRAAIRNPCGTAACIAGKAGLMPVFRRQGLRYNYQDSGQYQKQLEKFFGIAVTRAVFLGDWAISHIHTSKHARIVLSDLVAEADKCNPDWFCVRFTTDWLPTNKTARIVLKSQPKEKVFPVSGFRVTGRELDVIKDDPDVS